MLGVQVVQWRETEIQDIEENPIQNAVGSLCGMVIDWREVIEMRR